MMMTPTIPVALFDGNSGLRDSPHGGTLQVMCFIQLLRRAVAVYYRRCSLGYAGMARR